MLPPGRAPRGPSADSSSTPDGPLATGAPPRVPFVVPERRLITVYDLTALGWDDSLAVLDMLAEAVAARRQES